MQSARFGICKKGDKEVDRQTGAKPDKIKQE